MNFDGIYDDDFLDLLNDFDEWKDRYYPVPASSKTISNDIKRLEHSILKWSGVKKDVLKDYSLEYDHHFITNDDDFDEMVFSTETCALCVKYGVTCTSRDGIECPIVRATGNDCDSVYCVSGDDPQPMIDLLEKTLEFVKKGGVES